MNTNSARETPHFLQKSIIYQIFLRSFTPSGTLNSARPLLAHLKSLGVDIVYLCPVYLQDDDTNEAFWSERQLASGMKNACNPYRIMDYFAIDPEYGTARDLFDFVAEAHALGLRVLLDLVYYHCGPAATFIEKNPSFVKRNEKGEVCGHWHFPELNFDNPELRKYLWGNMEYYLREFKVDGYRCDVAFTVPLDFWEEGRRRLEEINPEVIMISEGDRVEDQLSAFDLNYAFEWEHSLRHLFNGEITAQELRDIWVKYCNTFPANSRFLRILENHDIVNDCGNIRLESKWGKLGVEAALFLNFMLDGVPFLYNGQEVCDDAPHSIFANRTHGCRYVIDWSKGMTQAGKDRMEYLRHIISIRRFLPALTQGDVRWLDNDHPKSVLSFMRTTKRQQLLASVNTTNQPKTVVISGAPYVATSKIHLQYGCDVKLEKGNLTIGMLPYAYLLLEGNYNE